MFVESRFAKTIVELLIILKSSVGRDGPTQLIVKPQGSYMKHLKVFCIVLSCFGLSVGWAANPAPPKLTKPEVNKDSWVMIEIWPEVKDITLSAYFLDFSYEKNKNLCDVTKRVFDRDQEARSKSGGKPMSSYRLCMSINDAIGQGYITAQ